MKNMELYKEILISILLGLLIMKWKGLLNLVGMDFHMSPSESIVTNEYYVGLLAALTLGYVFPKHPTHCGIWLMAGPVLITHTIFMLNHGIPNMWPVELLLLALLTVPYVTLSHIGSFIARRLEKR